MPILTPEEIREFFEVGFVIRPDVFPAGDIERMRAAFDRLERLAHRLGETRTYRGSRFVLEKTPRGTGGPAVRIHRIVWCGAAQPVLGEYGKDPRLLRMASQLLGSQEMHQLINQAHFKLPRDGVEFPWHQDSRHRRYGQGEWTDVNGRGSYVQTITAIDDITEENGPIRFIPGSCRLGHVDRPGGDDGRLPEDLIDSAKAVSATMKSGSVLLFGPYTFHSSLPNQAGRSRRTFINGFAYPGANSRIYPGAGAGRLVRAPK